MRRARDIILGADGRVTESIKWKTPTFAYRGNIASFNPSKHLLSIMFHRGAEIPGTHPRLEGDGKLVRTAISGMLSGLDQRQPVPERRLVGEARHARALLLALRLELGGALRRESGFVRRAAFPALGRSLDERGPGRERKCEQDAERQCRGAGGDRSSQPP